MTSKPFVLVALLLALVLFSVHTFATFVPRQGDYFSYYEVQNVGSGTGDYSGYTDRTIVNGAENVTGVATNGTVSAYYSDSWSFSSNDGSTDAGGKSGDFTFSSNNFLYINGTDDINGTDNQNGYVNPTVWFCMDDSIPEGGTFYLLNTLMTVSSQNYSYYLPSENRSVYAIFAKGSSNYERNDAYGQFAATYTWNAYFDPSSGYIIGYDYTEQDTNTSGTGFKYTENLYINSASYPLTTAPTTNPNADLILDAVLVAAVVIVIAIILIIVYAASRRRKLPKHPPQQPVYTPPSEPPPPPPPQDINLTPKQPPVQQIVIKEVVKVKCRYCGALIDSTAEKCPFCGAPRS